MPDSVPTSEAGQTGDRAEDSLLSVFDLRYIPTSACAAYDFTGKSYFSVPATTLEGMREAGAPEGVVGGIASSNFWQLIIERYSEQHSEDYSLHNTLSDSVAVFSCGAAPVTVRISGLLLTADHDDHRLAFLSRYLDRMRARRNTDAKRQLSFFIKGLSFNLIIKSLTFADSVSRESYARIEMEGWACHYPTRSAVYGYYGATAPTPVNKEEAEGEAREKSQEQSNAPAKADAKNKTATADDEVRVIAV